MTRSPFRSARPLATLAAGLALALVLSTAHAQDAPAPDSTMMKLIRGLIDSGALTPEVGQALLDEARREAAARTPASTGPALEPGDVRVPYISESVREGIREELKAEVLAQARAERWAAPDAVPEWTQRVQLTGDVRVRNESRLFSESNSTIETDWGRINAGAGYDINPNTNLDLPPLRNTRQDRNNSWRIRARLGVLAQLGEHTRAGVRLATGNDTSPVSTTQTLGGGLAKKDAWLDQAWLTWSPLPGLALTGGRFANPYWSTDILFSNDLNFDGVAARYEHALGAGGPTLFASLGLSPLEYSADNFPATRQDKQASRDKWLNGLQVGLDWGFGDDQRLRAALAYYQFRNISGEYSAPCALYAGAEVCSTDGTRPAFMQKGNTLMLLRNIALDPLDPANTPLPQYVGLASTFKLVDVNLSWETPALADHRLRLEGHWLKNTAYDPQAMWTRARGGLVTNLAAPAGATPTVADLKSGDTAWLVQGTFGDLALKQAGDWQLWLGYKHIEPDALPDGFNDSNFHLGGTNAKGYTLGAAYAFDRNVWLTGRWMAAKQIMGAPLAIDVFQLEVNAGF